MTVILGIDAAWTERGSTGVALLASNGDRWRCVAVAPSYQSFIAQSEGVPLDWSEPAFHGSAPRAADLLGAALRLAGAEVDVVAVDMPLSTMPITGRRAAEPRCRESSEAGAAPHTRLRPYVRAH